ncbi:hypothetical protein RGI145_07910 [Roseomonas gilardii]|uniref:Uncharacterized protein n=2 Tax=Roseomonas gilardii TaxID=257708 RepID=A0A1L7ADZ8_9PROT|nr:hypothetical protein RGI145_07910 [Roseomonas gilardii]
MRIFTHEHIRLRAETGHVMSVDIAPMGRTGWRAELRLLSHSGERWLPVGCFRGRHLDDLRVRSVDLAADILAAAACPAGGMA